jgi:hypothetical protein
MTNTLQPTSDTTWQIPVSYAEQAPQPTPETLGLPQDSFELQTDTNAQDVELANALYLASLEQPAVEPAYVTDARADVHHAINTSPEAQARVTGEANAKYVEASVMRAKAYTYGLGQMQDNALRQVGAELTTPDNRSYELAA